MSTDHEQSARDGDDPNSTVLLTLRLNRDVDRGVRALAWTLGSTKSTFLRDLIVEALDAGEVPAAVDVPARGPDDDFDPAVLRTVHLTRATWLEARQRASVVGRKRGAFLCDLAALGLAGRRAAGQVPWSEDPRKVPITTVSKIVVTREA